MQKREEIIRLLQEAIDTNRLNLVRSEAQKAPFGLKAPLDVINEIEYAKSEIRRLTGMLEEVVALRDNGAPPDDGETSAGLSAQISSLRAYVTERLHTGDQAREVLTATLQEVSAQVRRHTQLLSSLSRSCPLMQEGEQTCTQH